MTETQVIFRLEKRLLKEFERKKVLRKLKKLEVKGLEETDIEKMVNEWRSEKK